MGDITVTMPGKYFEPEETQAFQLSGISRPKVTFEQDGRNVKVYEFSTGRSDLAEVPTRDSISSQFFQALQDLAIHNQGVPKSASSGSDGRYSSHTAPTSEFRHRFDVMKTLKSARKNTNDRNRMSPTGKKANNCSNRKNELESSESTTSSSRDINLLDINSIMSKAKELPPLRYAGAMEVFERSLNPSDEGCGPNAQCKRMKTEHLAAEDASTALTGLPPEIFSSLSLKELRKMFTNLNKFRAVRFTPEEKTKVLESNETACVQHQEEVITLPIESTRTQFRQIDVYDFRPEGKLLPADKIKPMTKHKGHQFRSKHPWRDFFMISMGLAFGAAYGILLFLLILYGIEQTRLMWQVIEHGESDCQELQN